jgi:hypothetical protein
MSKISRGFKKFGAGFLGGLSTGGWYGAFTGGTTAAFIGGKAKPLKSFAYGAGAGLLGGTFARWQGWQGERTNIGGFSFKPASSYAYDFLKRFPKSKTAAAKEASIEGRTPPILPPNTRGGGQPWKPFMPGGLRGLIGEGEGAPPEGGDSWLPIAAVAGAVLILAA